MSSTLCWEPKHRETKTLPNALKYVLQKKEGLDGVINITMGESDLGYLQGLKDAGIEGAEELITAIEKHNQVLVQ